jgi:hypothetical protein
MCCWHIADGGLDGDADCNQSMQIAARLCASVFGMSPPSMEIALKSIVGVFCKPVVHVSCHNLGGSTLSHCIELSLLVFFNAFCA